MGVPAPSSRKRARPPRHRKRRHLEYEVIVVEDSSPDGTYDVALRLQALFGADVLKILKRPGKMGLGSAYIDGLSLVTGDFVFIMDADLSHHVRGGGARRSPRAHAHAHTQGRTTSLAGETSRVGRGGGGHGGSTWPRCCTSSVA